MDTTTLDIIFEKTDNYFSNKVHEYGATPQGMDWNSTEAQELRFLQLIKLFEDDDGFSICDYGCGAGSFLGFLRKRNPSKIINYIGIDISSAMIEKAKELYDGNEDECFICGHELNETYDYIIASGIFNIMEGTNASWKEYMLDIVGEFHAHSRKGFAFNCLTKYSDAEKMKDYLYYADPLFWFDYAKRNYSKNVALLHDYQLYDFTLLVRKDI